MQNQSLPEKYLNDFHQKKSEEGLKAVQEMSKQPLSHQQFIEQCNENWATRKRFWDKK